MMETRFACGKAMMIVLLPTPVLTGSGSMGLVVSDPPIDNLRPLSHPKRIHLVYGNSVFVASTEECQQSMDNVSEREVLIGAVKID